MSDERERWRVQWAGRTTPAIAEVAETLGIPTDYVMAVGVHGGRVTAMYSRPDDNRDPPAVFGQALDRDALGILRPVGESFPIPGMLEDVKRRVEGELGRRRKRK